MNILRPANTTAVLAENQDEFLNLPIVHGETVDGEPCMSSLWQPTDAERTAIINGGNVVLTVLGLRHPPVVLSVNTENGELVE